MLPWGPPQPQWHNIYTKLVHLDRQVQIHCIYPHSQSDEIQLNTPDYDPYIDGEPDPVTNEQSSNEEPAREDSPTDTSKSEDHTNIPMSTNRPECQPSEVLSDIPANKDNNCEPQ